VLIGTALTGCALRALISSCARRNGSAPLRGLAAPAASSSGLYLGPCEAHEGVRREVPHVEEPVLWGVLAMHVGIQLALPEAASEYLEALLVNEPTERETKMFDFQNGDKVIVLVAGNEAPGVVVDATVAPRDVPVSRRRDPRGFIHLPESIVVLSYREPEGRDGFYVERPEATFVVGPRTKKDDRIDGKSLAALQALVFESTRKLQQTQAANRATAPASA
jgi:hypothetical protein